MGDLIIVGVFLLLLLFPERTYPEQRNKEMSGNYNRSRRLLQTCYSGVQWSELDDTTSHQTPVTDW